MSFSSFNLTPIDLPSNNNKHNIPRSTMEGSHFYSYPLTGHLGSVDSTKSVHTKAWISYQTANLKQQLAKILPLAMLPEPSEITEMRKTFISYVVGGFIGSKSQENIDKVKPSTLGEVIVDRSEQVPEIKEVNSPPNSCQVFEKMMSNTIMKLAGQTDRSLMSLVRFGDSVPDKPKTNSCLSKALRLLSESSVDSDDDFVVFEGASACILDDDDEEDDWVDDSEDSECDEDEDNIQEATDKWNSYYSDTDTLDTTCSPTKVRFTPKPVVHVMRSWDFAYRAARVGPWEEAARDRVRFKERIQKTEEILAPILMEDHRRNVWERLQKEQ